MWCSPSPEWRKEQPKKSEVVDISEEGLIRGAGPIRLDFPQRGLGETGKSPNTTVKHNRLICGVLPCDLLLLAYSLCMIARYL